MLGVRALLLFAAKGGVANGVLRYGFLGCAAAVAQAILTMVLIWMGICLVVPIQAQ